MARPLKPPGPVARLEMLRSKPAAEISQERLTCLAYELLDAHEDTARLAADLAVDLRWQMHLDYLRDLQRVGREALAQGAGTNHERKPRLRRTGPSLISNSHKTRH
jgi:hypothetical protein